MLIEQVTGGQASERVNQESECKLWIKNALFGTQACSTLKYTEQKQKKGITGVPAFLECSACLCCAKLKLKIH